MLLLQHEPDLCAAPQRHLIRLYQCLLTLVQLGIGVFVAEKEGQ
jgi:hypothetical protein